MTATTKGIRPALTGCLPLCPTQFRSATRLIPGHLIVSSGAEAADTIGELARWAAGTSDTYALGILAEAPGLGITMALLPFVNSALAGRRAFHRSIDELQREGVRILLGPGEFEPHPPGAGGERIDSFPWLMALNEAERMSNSHPGLNPSLTDIDR